MSDALNPLQAALANRYRIERRLGQGGMAAVYLAHDLRHDRPVALKVLHPELAAALGPERFLREIRLAARLQHPHILPVFDSGESAGRLWYTMPYVEGESLRERLRREGRLQEEEVIRLTRELADALAYAHGEGVVHRDVKPENILLSRGHAMLADFGIARTLGRSGGEPGETLTATGLALGSPGYMSPEQVTGESVGSAADLFSLGVVLYESLTGRRPFGDSALGALRAMLLEPPLPPSRLNPSVSAALERLILRMLAPDSFQRPGASEVVVELARRDGTLRSAATVAPGPSARRLVGRAQERAELRAAFAATRSGRGLVLCVSGEPGIGKTTLTEDFLAELADGPEAPYIARGHCSERLAGSEAYLPILEALEELLRGEARETATRLVSALAPSWYGQIAAQLPGAAAGPGLPADAKAVSQERMKRELASLLHELSGLRSLVLLLEDMHWADPSTVDLLAYLATRFGSTRLLVVATYRPSDLLLADHPFLRVKLDLQSRGLCREIQLPFLSPAEVQRYIDLELPEHRLPPSLPELVHAKTEGSPLFMTDLLHYLRDRGVIVRAEGRWVLDRPLPELERELPQSVRGMIEKKIGQLGEAERRLLEAASVQGYQFDSATVARALDADPGDVEEQLQRLERVHGFVRGIGEHTLPDGTITLRHQFVHVLYQNALHGALTPTRRARLSAKAAQALLDQHGAQSPAIAAELAVLFEAARDLPRAIDHLLLAAQSATRIFAYGEAVNLVRRGLALVERLPEGAEHTGREIMLLLTLGSLLIATRGAGDPEVETAYRRAQELSLTEGESPRLFTAFRGLSEFYHTRGPTEAGLAYGRQALAVAQRLGRHELMVDAHHAVAMPLLYLGELEEARDHVERGVAIHDPGQRREYAARFYHAIDPGVGCHFQASRLLWLLGYPDQARRHAEEGIALAQRLSHGLSLAWIHAAAAAVHQCRREPRRAEEHAARSLALAREHEWPEIAGWGLAWHGWAAAVLGRHGEGIAEMRVGIAALASHSGLRPHLLALLAEGLWLAGERNEALSRIAEALETSETGGRYYRAELHRLRGELLLRRPAPGLAVDTPASAAPASGPILAEAERSLRQALEIAGAQRARSLELRAALSLCRLLEGRAGGLDARALLEQAYRSFTEGFDTPDLQDAATLLGEFPPSSTGSPREG